MWYPKELHMVPFSEEQETMSQLEETRLPKGSQPQLIPEIWQRQVFEF